MFESVKGLQAFWGSYNTKRLEEKFLLPSSLFIIGWYNYGKNKSERVRTYP